MLRRTTRLLLALALVAAMSGFAAAQAPKYGGIWYDALPSNPPHLDPVFSTDTTSAEVEYQIFETLLEYAPDGTLQPLLAESYEVSEDGLTFTFHLRRGVHFHATTEGGTPTANGGREVTAHDWVWTFNYITDPKTNSPRAYFVDMIKGYEEYRNGEADHLAGVRALDDYTLQIEITYPFAPFVQVLAYNTFSVLPREDVEKWGTADFNFHPVGTGPFKFEEWRQDDVIRLSRNENYWMKDEDGNQLPYLDGIEFRIIPGGGATEWAEYQLGNIYATRVDDPYYRQVTAGKETEIRPGVRTVETQHGVFWEGPQPGVYYYGFNVEKITDKRVRQALNYAINREALINLVINGRALPATGILPPSIPGFNPDLEGYTYNPAKARELLAEAGYGPDNPLELTLQYNTDPGHQRIAEAIQAQLKAVGVNLSLREVEWGTHLDTTERGEVPFFRLGWVADYLDADNFLYVLLHSDNIGPEGNYSRFNNPTFDMLTKAARLSTDEEERIRLYREAEKIAVEEAPWLFIYFYTDHNLVKPFVRNYDLPAFGQYSNKFRNVWLDL
ncbi:ABC transporter substrate-binding protein [Limnochorda sp.]|uniref:ABC transporter substrate-binding protein n=1 Tax=Limnochorda sp. TaxID=1940279 RepID=UPI001ECC9AF2|nr:ABC transporter substrate-binding protein [Bacillota bacterium]